METVALHGDARTVPGMHKPAAAATARRAPTLAGANPPRIALTVSQVATTLLAVAQTSGSCMHLTTHSLTPVLVSAIADSTSDRLRFTVIDSLVEAVHSHLLEHPACGHGLFNETPVTTTLRLEAAWDDAADGKLDDVIRSAQALGVDAEMLCWAVIGIESLNHVGLIRKEASKFVKKLPHTRPDDLMGYGWSGLRAALRAYEPALGFTFSTYACPKINGAIRDGVRAESPVPKRLTTLARAASAAEEKLTHELSRVPSYAEIVDYLNADTAHARLLPRLRDAASIEELHEAHGDHDAIDLGEVDDPADLALRKARVDAVRDAVATLPEDSRTLIEMLHFDELSLAEAARRLGSDTRTLRALKTAAYDELADALKSWTSSSVEAADSDVVASAYALA